MNFDEIMMQCLRQDKKMLINVQLMEEWSQMDPEVGKCPISIVKSQATMWDCMEL